MKQPLAEQNTPLTDAVDRELSAYLACSGIAPSTKIRSWWGDLTPEQRRDLLETLDLTG